MADRSALWALIPLTALALAACGPAGTHSGDDGGTVADAAGDAASDAAPQGPVTYWRDIAPVINARCTQCHTQGGLGPMPLETYDQVRATAALVAHVTGTHEMPPWPPTQQGCRELQDPRVLTDAQIAALASWATNGTPEGNQADYQPLPASSTSRPLPEHGDVMVQPTEPYTPNANLTDDYHCFVVDPQLTDTRDVVGVRVLPGNARIVHHVILYEVREAALPQLQALDDAEPGPGYTCFSDAGVNANVRAAAAGSGDLADFDEQMVTGWAPGSPPGYFPTGTGIRLKPGSRLVMQVHYNMTAADTHGMTDQSRVELYFAPTPQPFQAFWLPMAQPSFSVPAGAGVNDPAATVTATQVQTLPIRAHGVFPHMHLRGHEIRVDVTHHDGSTDCLVDIPQWSFHWQQSYWFTSPLRPVTASGSADTVKLTCVYDNTQANQPVVNGAQEAPHVLHWGEGTDDEMCLNFFYVSL